MRLPQGVKEIRGANWRGANYPCCDITEKIIGCAIRVHKELRAGYVESIYENAMAHELSKAGVNFERQKKLPVYYDGVIAGEHRADLIVEGKVSVELKAVSHVTDTDVARLMSTMRAAETRVGLLLNFHEARLVDGVRRIVW